MAAAWRALPWVLLGVVVLLLGIPPYWVMPEPPPHTALEVAAPALMAPPDLATFRYAVEVGPAGVEDVALHFVSASPRARLLLNGVEVFARAAPGGAYVLARPIPVLLRLPAPLLRPGVNDLILETSGFGRAQGRAPPLFMGAAAVLRPYHGRAWLLQEVLPQVVLGASLLLGGLLLGLWCGRRHEHAYLALAALLLLNGGKLLLFLAPSLELPAVLIRLAGAIGIMQVGVLPAFVAAFVGHPLGRPLGGPLGRWLWLTAPAGVLLVGLLLLLPDAPRLRYTLAMAIPFVGLCIAICIGVLLPAAGRGRSTAARVLLGLGVLFAAILALDLARRSGEVGGMLIFGVLLVRQWGATMNALDDANRHMAQELHAAEVLLTETLGQRHAQEQQALLQAERERLMRDLHDGVGNGLVSALALCSLGEATGAEMAASLRGTLGELRLVVTALDDMHGDLAGGIASFLPQLQRQVRPLGVALECDVADLPPVPWLRPAHMQHVLRILQEAVMNAARHSGAAVVRIEAGAAARRITVRDQGCGGAQEREGSFGMRTMQARAREVGATLRVTSGPQGTEVVLDLP